MSPTATCLSCLFYQPAYATTGLCRRYPTTEDVGAKDWCGEYKSGSVVAQKIAAVKAGGGGAGKRETR